MLGKTLAQYCPTDTAMAREQKRIEGELLAFEKNIWGDQARKDSLDSIAKLDKKELKKTKRTRSAKTARTTTATTKVKKAPRSKSSSSSGSKARVSVRRERH